MELLRLVDVEFQQIPARRQFLTGDLFGPFRSSGCRQAQRVLPEVPISQVFNVGLNQVPNPIRSLSQCGPVDGSTSIRPSDWCCHRKASRYRRLYSSMTQIYWKLRCYCLPSLFQMTRKNPKMQSSEQISPLAFPKFLTVPHAENSAKPRKKCDSSEMAETQR